MGDKRVKYYNRQLVEPSDLFLDQNYHINKILDLENNILGDGVVSGLIVSSNTLPVSQISDDTDLNTFAAGGNLLDLVVQIFQAKSSNIQKIYIKGRQVGAIGNLILSLYNLSDATDPNSGLGTLISQTSIGLPTVGGVDQEIEFDFTGISSISDNGSFTVGNYYAIQLSRDSNLGDFTIRYQNVSGYSLGFLKEFDANSSTWISYSNSDLYFKVYSDSVQITSGVAYKNGYYIGVDSGVSVIDLVDTSGIDNYMSIRYVEQNTDIESNPVTGLSEYSRIEDTYEIQLTTSLPDLTSVWLRLYKISHVDGETLTITDIRPIAPYSDYVLVSGVYQNRWNIQNLIVSNSADIILGSISDINGNLLIDENGDITNVNLEISAGKTINDKTGTTLIDEDGNTSDLTISDSDFEISAGKTITDKLANTIIDENGDITNANLEISAGKEITDRHGNQVLDENGYFYDKDEWLTLLSAIHGNEIIEKVSVQKFEINPEEMGGNYWTSKANMNTARRSLAGFSANNSGYSSGGSVGAVLFSSVTEQYNDDTNSWSNKTGLNAARYGLAGFSLNNYGYVTGGVNEFFIPFVTGTITEQYDTNSDSWTTKSEFATFVFLHAGFSLNNYGYIVGGDDGTSKLDTSVQYDPDSDSWTAKANILVSIKDTSGFSLNNYGYFAGGDTGVASDAVEKYNDSANSWEAKENLISSRHSLCAFSSINFGYTAGGYSVAITNVTEQYNDNSDLWISRYNLNTSRETLSSFNLNGIGYTFGGSTGVDSAVTEQYRNTNIYQITKSFKKSTDTPYRILIGTTLNGDVYKLPIQIRTDDTNWKYMVSGEDSALKPGEAYSTKFLAGANSYRNYEIKVGIPQLNEALGGAYWTYKSNLNTARAILSGISLNGFGYAIGGSDGAVTAVSERYNETTDAWTAITSLNTARWGLSAFSLSGFGFTAGGWTGAAVSAASEKYSPDTDSWAAITNLNTARQVLSAFSLNGFGYTAGGSDGAPSAVTEQYDINANTWAAKTNLNTARESLSAFSLDGFGYTAGGNTGVNSAVTEQYADFTNTWASKANLNTARSSLYAFPLNRFGYTAGGITGAVSSVVERYNTFSNTWATNVSLQTARRRLSAFSLNDSGYTSGGYDVTELSTTEKYNYFKNLVNLNIAISVIDQ